MSQTARTARLLEAATTDLKASAMPAYAVGYEREWLLGTLIGKIEGAAMFRDLGNMAKADELLDEVNIIIKHLCVSGLISTSANT